LSADFKIAETDSFRKLINRPQYRGLYHKFVDYIYPQLRRNPFFGANIKKLKGDLSHYYRYRIGNYRLFDSIVPEKHLVIIVTISGRKDAY
jgi:mRNA interferase RelE/StbE